MATLTLFSQTTLNTPANNLVFALYDSSAPTVALETIAPPKPYGNPLEVMFAYNCLKGHVYIHKVWESADTTPTGAVRNSGQVTINGHQVRVKTTEYLFVDNTDGLVSGTTSYDNVNWAGWSYQIFRTFIMIPDDAPDLIEADYSRKVTGGFDLLKDGDTFQNQENFVVTFEPQVIDAAPVGTPSGPFSSGRQINFNETLTNADANSALFLEGGSSQLVITLPALSTVIDFTDMFYFFSGVGSHINVPLVSAGSDVVNFKGDTDRVILGRMETAILYKAFGKWQVFNDLQGLKNVGEIITKPSKGDLNTLFLDGSSSLLRARYPRLWAYIETLEASAVVTQSAWNSATTDLDGVTYYTNKCKFHTGDGLTTFGIPLLYDRFIRGADGSTRIAGNLQLYAVQTHDHTTHGKGSITPVRGLARFLSRLSGGRYSGGGGDQFGGSTSVDETLRTGDTGSAETRPINAGEYLSIRI